MLDILHSFTVDVRRENKNWGVRTTASSSFQFGCLPGLNTKVLQNDSSVTLTAVSQSDSICQVVRRSPSPYSSTLGVQVTVISGTNIIIQLYIRQLYHSPTFMLL